MKIHNLTPLVRWVCRLSAAAVVVLAVAGMSCSTNGEADTGETPSKAAALGKPVVVQAWLVEVGEPLFEPSPDALTRAARGDLTGLFPASEGRNLAGILQGAEAEGRAKILLAPSFLTRTGESLDARSGLQTPVQTMVQGGLNVQYVDATVRFDAVVRESGDGLMDVEVAFKKNIPRYDMQGSESANAPIQTTDGGGLAVVSNGGTAVFCGANVISGLYATGRQEAEAVVTGELVLFVTATLSEF
jgi:hypothetical protein